MATFSFSRVGNLCQTNIVSSSIRLLNAVTFISYWTLAEKCNIRVGDDSNALYINSQNPADIEVAGVACVSAADFRAKMAAMLLIAAGSGGTPALTATQIAFGDAGNLMTSSSNLKYTEAAGLQMDNRKGFLLGDIINGGTGDVLALDGNGGFGAYYDNAAHTGKFGINRSTPSVSLDVLGEILLTAAANMTMKLSTTDFQAGDIDVTQNGTKIILNDINNTINLTTSTANKFLLDGGTIKIGDVGNIGNGMKIVVTDSGSSIKLTGLQAFGTNALAITGGLTAGDLFYTNTLGQATLKIVI